MCKVSQRAPNRCTDLPEGAKGSLFPLDHRTTNMNLRNTSNSLETGPLRAYERHVAVVLVSLMIGLGLLATHEKIVDEESQPAEKIMIHLVGAVTASDVFVPRGATVDEVLRVVSIDKAADLTEIDGTRRLMREETVVIPYTGRLTLFVNGAVVEPKTVVAEQGAKAQDILDQVQVREDADVKAFLRRKKFTTGTVVDVKLKRSKRRVQSVKAEEH